MEVKQRMQVVRRNHYCFNCLARTHLTRACDSPDTCLKCAQPHHTLLHARRTSVHDRIGQRHDNTNQRNKRTKPSKHQRNKRANHSKNQRKARGQSTNRNQPDIKILSEAIRSLATVLCVTPTPSSVA